MSPTAWLACEIHDIVLIVFRKLSSPRHSTLTRKFSVSAVQTGFELSSLRHVHLIVVALIVDVSASVLVGLAAVVVVFEVVCEKIDASIVFYHLVNVVNVEHKVVLWVQNAVVVLFHVHVVVLREHGRRGSGSWMLPLAWIAIISFFARPHIRLEGGAALEEASSSASLPRLRPPARFAEDILACGGELLNGQQGCYWVFSCEYIPHVGCVMWCLVGCL